MYSFRFTTGPFAHARRGRKRSVRRGGVARHAAADGAVCEWRRCGQRRERGNATRDPRAAGPVPEEHRRADGEY